MLICRNGDEGAPAAEPLPLAGEDWKNIGLEASCDVRVARGVPFLEAFCEDPSAGAGLLRGGCEERRLRLGVADCELRCDLRGAGEDILAAVRRRR